MASRALLSSSLRDLRNVNTALFTRNIHGSAPLCKKGKAASLAIREEMIDRRITYEDRYEPKKTSYDLPTLIKVNAQEPVHICSGVPEEHIKTRKVRIYQPPKNSMQSGTDNINYWQIDFDTRERWENPLMGWCSSGDPMSNIKVDFASKEEAIEHCEKMSWDYFIQKPNKKEPRPRSYGANFSWNKRTRVTTK